MNGDIHVFAGRFAGSFDLNAEDGGGLGHDSEVTMLVRGIVKKVTLEDTRSGELRLFFVIRPQDAWVHRPEPTALDSMGGGDGPEEGLVEAMQPLQSEAMAALDDEHDDPDPFLEGDRAAPVEPPLISSGPPRGKRVSTVQPNSNVAGSSQAERDTTLAQFLYEETRS